MNLYNIKDKQLLNIEDLKNVLKDCLSTWIYLESLGIKIEGTYTV